MRGTKENFYGYYSDLLSTAFSDGLAEIYNTEEGNFMFVGKISDYQLNQEVTPAKTEPTYLVLSSFRNANSDLGYVGLLSSSDSIFFRISVTYDHEMPMDDSFDDKPTILKNRSLSLFHNGQVLDVSPGSEEEKLFKKFLGLSQKAEPVNDLERFKTTACMKQKIEDILVSGACPS